MDDLIHESLVFEWILEQHREDCIAAGIAEDTAEAIAKGIAEATARRLSFTYGIIWGGFQTQRVVVEIVEERFPELAQLAEEIVVAIDILTHLERLAGKLSGAQSTEQARQILLDARLDHSRALEIRGITRSKEDIEKAKHWFKRASETDAEIIAREKKGEGS